MGRTRTSTISNMDLGIRGKVGLVAASSRGLGHAAADELASAGVDVIVCSRSADAVSEVAANLAKAHGVRTVGVAGDLTIPDDVARIVQEGVAALGPIDILITNTGGPPSGVFEDLSPEMWQQAVRQNLDSVVNLTRAVLAGMKERRWGRIVNITSITVKQPVDNLMLSNAVRAAVTGFAKTLSNEVAPHGVTVNNVVPGYTRTERVEQLARAQAERRGISEAEAIAEWERQIPMGRIADPREFGAVVAFLASERASYITGVSLPVDGGWIKSLY